MTEVVTPLVNEHCEACNAETPKLQGAQIEDLLRAVSSDWKMSSEKLACRFKFPDFTRAFSFATGVGLIAESEGHHPDLQVGWGYVNVELTTHAIHGLSRNDFIMAAKIDKLRA